MHPSDTVYYLPIEFRSSYSMPGPRCTVDQTTAPANLITTDRSLEKQILSSIASARLASTLCPFHCQGLETTRRACPRGRGHSGAQPLSDPMKRPGPCSEADECRAGTCGHGLGAHGGTDARERMKLHLNPFEVIHEASKKFLVLALLGRPSADHIHPPYFIHKLQASVKRRCVGPDRPPLVRVPHSRRDPLRAEVVPVVNDWQSRPLRSTSEGTKHIE